MSDCLPSLSVAANPASGSNAAFLDSTGNLSTYSGMYAKFSTADLASIGDQLTLSFTVTVSDTVQANQDSAFFFGLGSSTATGFVGSATAASYAGGIGTAGASATSGIFQEDGSTRGPLATNNKTGADFTSLQSTTDLTLLSDSDPGNSTYFSQAYSLTLTRVASGTEITLSDGTNSSTFIDTTPLYSFNSVGFAIQPRGSENDLYLDDVLVTFHPIPEPSSLLLLAIGSVFFLMPRRRALS